ncbi:DUF1697 domain-containing protein [Solimicrobium silvestre]|uniref:DUF1697 domain-containing protein n=1 Tax=Solimicrobium silvestre TaxID=2099400 RepID=A0A2S9GYS9_9BURK|nr:DUF1697 domain-containing protein [Solimicrobium silvestre]PRC92885.1 hypothetical protein S2091_2302 [Solimicrobium silvestre]
MKTWIALLRGINVGGRNKLPMKALAAELESLGLSDIKTYIQSGNVVFRGSDTRARNIATSIGAAIHAKFGFEPPVIVISDKDLADAITANPFPESTTEKEGRTLHFFFLDKAPSNIDHDRLESVRRPSERWQVKGTVLYLHTPEGFGDSKLAVQIERIFGVTATARNWRTVCALRDLSVE